MAGSSDMCVCLSRISPACKTGTCIDTTSKLSGVICSSGRFTSLMALYCTTCPYVPCRLLKSIQCPRSEEHTSELQSLMRISYAVFCLKKKITQITIQYTNQHIHEDNKQRKTI